MHLLTKTFNGQQSVRNSNRAREDPTKKQIPTTGSNHDRMLSFPTLFRNKQPHLHFSLPSSLRHTSLITECFCSDQEGEVCVSAVSSFLVCMQAGLIVCSSISSPCNRMTNVESNRMGTLDRLTEVEEEVSCPSYPQQHQEAVMAPWKSVTQPERRGAENAGRAAIQTSEHCPGEFSNTRTNRIGVVPVRNRTQSIRNTYP